ncbi:hypothetical protein FRC17_007030, partial [Serendipita sp. 399]
IASHNANEVTSYPLGTNMTATEVIEWVWEADDTSCQEMLQSSFASKETFGPLRNGFVTTIVEAYNRHHHLVIRPDDIWCAILNQFSFYVNANAEGLRSKFVVHEGTKELTVYADGTRYTVNFGKMANDMGELLKKNIVDETLHEWITPNYTTTTPNDVVVCSVMMMSILQKYFSFKMSLGCGIPSITLLGEKEDYLAILFRLDKLEEFGKEPTVFARFLRPILKEFVAAFDPVREGTCTPNPEFWGKICHSHSGGSGPTWLGGWLTAFCVWNAEGKWQGGNLEDINKPLTSEEISRLKRNSFGPQPPLVLANTRYPVIDMEDIPKGYCQVDVKLDDNGELFDCLMIAGH